MGAIRINQMGYTTTGLKQLIYIGVEKEFTIIRVSDKKVVFQGKLTESRYDDASDERVRLGDFSEIRLPDEYYIQIGMENSCQFCISDQQPVICTDALLKGLYYQRCGIELTEEYAGQWKHSLCHHQPAYLFRQDAEVLLKVDPEQLERIDTIGGWHDAGDYGRYTVATAKTVADMMLAYEHYKSVFNHPVGIPESNLEGADILHEIRIGLDFLLKMQNKKNGSVYTKVATRYFPGMIMPEEDGETLFVFDISSPATGAFAAVMAMAARVFQKFNSLYAESCLQAAIHAYQWLMEHPEPMLFKNPKDIISGEYGDDLDIDERYWAAAQLYHATGEEVYQREFTFYSKKLEDRLSLGWRQVSGYGTLAYLTTDRKVDKELYITLKKEWLDAAATLEERSNSNGYGITLALKDYCWGSNMVLLNQTIHLIIANRLQKKSIYHDIIQRNWEYIFGRNPMDICYVTGLGTKSIKYPHHRPSATDGVEAPVPGLLSGGPNLSLQDEVAREYCKGNSPAKCFYDHTDSFSTNEIDTYWNSPAIYVGAYLCQLPVLL